MDSDNILFFATVDDNPVYQQFIFPFIASALITHPNASCEVLVSDINLFIQTYPSEINSLYNTFPNRSIYIGPWWMGLSSVSTEKFESQPHPGAFIRFLTHPLLSSPEIEYTYITDIDMLFIDDILPIHRTVMEATGLPYTNIIRPETQRMSGCLMVRSTEYYDAILPVVREYIQDPESIYYPVHNDEELLYQLIRKSKLPLPNRRWDDSLRPIPAIHTSVNRAIDGDVREGVKYPGWRCIPEKLRKAEVLFETSEWQELELPEGYRETFLKPIEMKMEDVADD